VAYEARGYKQAGQTDGRADMQADGPNRAKIAHSTIYGSYIKNRYRAWSVTFLLAERRSSDVHYVRTQHLNFLLFLDII